MTATVTRDTRITNARNFIKSFSNDAIYLAIGNSEPWDNESNPPTPLDNVADLQFTYNNILGYKKVLPNNVFSVAKRFDWEANKSYARYDDSQTSPVQTIVDQGGFTVNAPTYVITAAGNVYKCIDTPIVNGQVQYSTTEPTNTSTTGTFTTADGYVWKYMYDLTLIQATQRLTDEWMPVYTALADDGSTQAQVRSGAVDGAIHRIRVVDGGTGYVSGEAVTLVDANGVGFAGEVVEVAGEIVAIDITNIGSGYHNVTAINIATVGGMGAILEPVYSPVGGHGFDATKELFGTYAMVRVLMNGDEGGNLPVGDDFRTVCMVVNPKLTTTGVELFVTGTSYAQFEVGDMVSVVGNGAINGIVVKWDATTGQLWLSTVSGSFTGGGIQSIEVVGTDKVGIVSSVKDPSYLPAMTESVAVVDMQYGTGEVVYIENRVPILRNASQTEEVRLVIEF